MLKAKDIMTSEVITVKMETTVNELAEILWKNRISGAPVLDDDGNMIELTPEIVREDMAFWSYIMFQVNL